MLITAIEPRRKSLRALYLDGELAVNIDAQTLLSSRFQVGTEITDEELHELLAASDANRAKEKALYLIAHRDHSKKELVDKIRRTASQEAAEKAAASSGSAVTLGVGLHSGYGPAQRLYVKRGYIPDGSGVWFRDQPLDPYADCRNDDELILYMSKKLKREGGADDEA